MISDRTSQQLSQQRFVVLLLVVEMIVAVMFCIYVRYDDSIKPNSPEGHLANDSSSKPAPLKAHEDTYPCRPFVQCDQIGHFWMFKFPYQSSQNVWWLQCDQIGRFIALWATFQSMWQQLFCPNRHKNRSINSCQNDVSRNFIDSIWAKN